ncbi:unnamed protein product [Vitrella brassicaformis CCMP3155]|uniref:Ras-related GTP-binding protein n=1 Tax=Vitrella brassicaformis (strain CCMP3155) TaxID=1169540 RepID=A0A0G4EFF1_VITBC|nr:unnamed protein product [Vitrella brassicaformis CCMP3155]|eukprot:CEL94157.1 unnamed protein product [Vitrella brassicaformis CCMP3155]
MAQPSPKKVLLMGRAGAGKTSMRSIIFANYLARETKRFTYTNHVEQSHLRFLGNLILSLWDCGGQDTFMENYFESQREHIFRNCEVLIYVIGLSPATIDIALKSSGGNEPSGAQSKPPATTKEFEKDFVYWKQTAESIRQFSPFATVFCLVHKMDLVKEQDRERVFAFYDGELRRLGGDLRRIQTFATSIWDETLFKAWSDIVNCLIPYVNVLNAHLKHFCSVAQADEVVLFEKSTFLVIASASDEHHKDPHRFEKISNIAKQFKLTCGKSQANFTTLTVQNSFFRAFIDKFTDNTYIMAIITNKEVPSAAVLINIDLARSHFDRIAASMPSGPTL